MAIPFKLPHYRKREIRAQYAQKDRVVSSAVLHMERVMATAVGYIIDHYVSTGMFAEPSLNEMENVGEEFYRRVITDAVSASQQEKKITNTTKKLAAPGPLGLPRKVKGLDSIFRNRKYWDRILNRNKKLTTRLRKQYLEKLRDVFQKIVPLLDQGEITPTDAKDAMMDAWQSSKSRVETIFRTETTTYFSKTQTAFYEGDEDIIGFLFDSVRDTSRTEWCQTRHGLIYEPGSKLLRENTPACFLGFTPVLTLSGWVRIDEVRVGDYVWTHQGRWRPVLQVFENEAPFPDFIQIGYAVATPNHPYLEKSGSFVEAIAFSPYRGVWESPSFAVCVFEAILGALFNLSPLLFLNSVRLNAPSKYSVSYLASLFYWGRRKYPWRIEGIGGVFPDHLQKKWASIGEILELATKKTPESEKKLPEEIKTVEEFENFKCSSPNPYVYNLEVADDHTYVAGGYVVHNCHWNCRSHLIALANNEHNRKLLEDPERDAKKAHASGKVAPLPTGWRK